MPFWKGSRADLQSQRAVISQDLGQWDTPLPSLIGKDTFFGGAGKTPNYDWPNPSFVVQGRAANQVARLAQDSSQIHQFTRELIGKDAVNPGKQCYDLPPRAPTRIQTALEPGIQSLALTVAPAATTLPTGVQFVDLPPPGALRAREYGQATAFPLELLGQDQFNAGAQSFELPPRAAARAADYTWLQTFSLDVYEQEPAGASTAATELPPRAPARAPDYSFIASFPPELIGQDQLPTGKQCYDLPPRAPARSRDYSFVATFPLVLIGQDAVNVGAQSTDLPSRGSARAADYTFTGSFPLELIGQDAVNTGQSTYDLPVPAAPRRQTALDPGVIALALTAPPVGASTFDLPPRGPARSRDYTFIASFPLELLGQDATNVGEQSYDLPPRAAPRIQSTFEPGVTSLALTVAPVFLPYGAQYYDLPALLGAARARDYTFVASFPLELNGKDAVNPGKSTLATELPPRGPARSRDYTFTASFLLELNSKDVFFRGAGDAPDYDWPNPSFIVQTRAAYQAARLSQASDQVHQYTLELIGKDKFNPGAQVYDLPTPRGPRARDYTFTASFPFSLIGQDALNTGAQITALPPRGPARAADYTFVASFTLELIGQDRLPTGKQSTDLPTPPAPKRARDYTFTASFPLELIGKDRVNPGEQTCDLPVPPAPRRQPALEPGLQSLALTVVPTRPVGTQSIDLPPAAAPRRLPALDLTTQPLALEAAVAPVLPSPEVPAEQQKREGYRRRRLTRYRPEQPRYVSGRLSAPRPTLQMQAHATPAPREVTAWLTPPQPTLRLAVHVLNRRHVNARLLAPTPRLRNCRQSAASACTTLPVQAARPTLQARLTHAPDEAWLLAMLLADSRDAMRAWDAEATKRLSNLERESNAQVTRIDRQQHRLVQAALPHLRHAFSAQRDAILVALPHASKASVDPDYVLNDQGFLNAVALLIQAIENTQQAGVTLGYTDAAPPDTFNLSSPYIDAAINQLATRVAGITDTTAQAIRDVIAQGLSEGWSVAEMGAVIQQLGAFSEARALTIAMTESRVALNTGNAAAWQDMGVEEVLIADGDYDEVCAELDGTTQTLDWYIANPISHPRCRRTATAIPAAVPA